jgi:hypothetical protein
MSASLHNLLDFVQRKEESRGRPTVRWKMCNEIDADPWKSEDAERFGWMKSSGGGKRD